MSIQFSWLKLAKEMRKPLNDLLVCLTHFLLCFKFTQAFETVTHADTSPNNVSSGLAGKAMRHYAVPPYTGSSQPQLYAVQPQYPQYYFGPQPQNPCLLPQQVGTGPYRIPRWYFNPARQACELFYWSGCCGNSNNFQTYHDCQKRCEGGNAAKPNTVVFVPFTLTFTMKPTGNTNLQPLPTAQTANCQSGDCPKGHIAGSGAPLVPITPVPRFIPVTPSSPHLPPPVPTAQLRPIPAIVRVCDLELDSGVGSMEIIRYYYNKRTRMCEEFRYRGQGGNRNNFLSLPECRKVCPESPSPCAYGDLTPANQPLQCQPGTTVAQTCGGEQFCHIGASPQTTVCCPKPADLDPCGQPMSTGVGNANLQRWYFNSMAQQCQPLQYRGLQGNENNFLTQNACQAQCQVNPCRVGIPFRNTNGMLAYCAANDASECPTGYYCHIGANAQTSVCCQALGSDPCGQPLDSGTGGARLQRWFWNAQAGCCQPFNYCGLRGTQNNFLTREDCEQTCMVINPCKLPVPLPLEQCVPGPNACAARPNMYCHVGAVPQTTVCCPAETPNPCELPVDPGAGRDRLERWFYNAQTSICQPFTYNGIKGNQNNFLSQQDCEELCVPNPCAEGRPFVGADGRPQTCSPSASMNTCPANHWCHVGATQLTTVCCPAARPNPCTLPMSTGEGDASLERFYFDQSTKTCKPFEYRGLKGNQNNFLSQRACQLACQPLDNPCIGQPATTPTGQVLFCSSTNKDTCPVNFWCHLGATPETTVCCPGATNPCSVPLAPGTGNSGLSRWYYNTDERQCVPFQYNGKRGNQNNFLSQNECERTCPEQLCLLSIDKGACSGRQTRFAFNRQTSQCVPFEYTGCGGNLNNFLTMEDCVATCGNVGF